MFNCAEAAGGNEKSLSIMDGSLPNEPLVSIPINQPFFVSCIHPKSGKLIVLADPERIGSKRIMFFMFGTTISEITLWV
jgi:hypothetical protein